MSDPVTNVEIEDVLSSIRRLVSADERGEARPSQAEKDPAPDKLVLTPALRVSDAEAGSAPSDAPESGEAKPEPPAVREEDTALREAPDRTVEARSAWEDDAAEDDGWEDQAQAEGAAPQDDGEGYDTDPDAIAAADDGTPARDVWADEVDTIDNADPEPEPALQEEVEEETVLDADAEDGAEETLSEPSLERDEAGDRLRAHVAGFEEAVAAREENWEPDGESDDENAAHPTEALPWEDVEEDRDTDAADEIAEDDAEEERAEDDEAWISERPDAVPPDEGLEPFEAMEDDFAPDLAAAAAADLAEEAARVSRNAFMEEEDPLGDDLGVLDEEALRDLVTEIVRQELQGALGERITRNVRKLVRREIHRALTAQELE